LILVKRGKSWGNKVPDGIPIKDAFFGFLSRLAALTSQLLVKTLEERRGPQSRDKTNDHSDTILKHFCLDKRGLLWVQLNFV